MVPPAGKKLGAYAIIAPLGSGGMGQVYRAWDERLRREVAIKTIRTDRAADPEALARFEREAHALAALNHPNLLSIYDIGSQDGVEYIVSELLEGETLRARLIEGPIPLHRALNFAIQIVRALAAAHEKGFLHRDLKPDNIFITNDGQVKLLDFGLTKLIGDQASLATSPEDFQTSTVTGKVLGTPGYMSPEQVRGYSVDHRSDIFSFGAVFYEMLTSQRAFPGHTPADVISATLNHDPEDPCQITVGTPTAAGLVIRHCLEKRAEDRFQSARDLLFDLEMLTTPSASLAGNTPFKQAIAVESAKRRPLAWIPIALLLMLAVAMGIVWFRSLRQPLPSFTQITFHRSSIWEARFTADGNTVLYNASWAGNPPDIFATRLGSTESQPLGIENADLLSVSSKGELAILLKRQGVEPWFNRGTLARMPLGGGTPKEIVEDVQTADWSPDGANLAIVHHVNGEQQVEYPIGTVLFRTPGWITNIRVSPFGNEIAFMEHGSQWDDRGWISVVDLKGHARRLAGEFSSEHGLAWWPDGRSIWFTATVSGGARKLYSVSLDGKQRTVYTAPTSLQLHDIGRDNSVLLSSYKDLTSVVALAPGQTTERDLSWLDESTLFDLSSDGKTFLFQYFGEGSGPNYSSYIGKTDGSPPIRLGEGGARALSPDGKWAVAVLPQTHETVLLPVGAGQVRTLARNGLIDHGDDSWTPDSQHLVFSAQEKGKQVRCYIQDIQGGMPQPLGPEGLVNPRISPDGKLMLARQDRQYVLLRLDRNAIEPVRGIDPDEEIVRWSADSRFLYVTRPERVVRLFQVDPNNGHRQLLREINPADPAGIIGYPVLFVSGDGKSFVYSFVRKISELYVARNLAK